MNTNIFALSFAAALAMGAAPALAQSAGDWTVGLGLHNVQPKSGNGLLAGAESDVGSDARPTITVEYFIRDNIGIEVLAALPFKHDVSLAGMGRVGEVQHLPPVISLQYHFTNDGKITPFVGAGLNYTVFFKEKTTGALAGNELELEDSLGLALHAGLDYQITERSALRADIRWMDIDSEVKLNGTTIGEVEIDPVVLGVAFVRKF